MGPKKLSIEELDAIARTWISVAAKSARGRELLRQFAAGGFTKGVSVIDQLPPDLAEDFTKTLNEVYEELIKGHEGECYS